MAKAEAGLERPAKQIAILAGSGRLPEILACHLLATANPPLVIDLVGDMSRWQGKAEAIHIPPSKPGLARKILRDRGIDTITLVGGISRRPRLTELGPDAMFIKHAFSIMRALWRGDDGLLKIVVRVFESEGFRVIGAHEIKPDILAPGKVVTGTHPSAEHEADMALAMQAARDLGSRDKGQAAVARAGTVIALEGRPGTARMLAALAQQDHPSAPAGVLAKVSKPGQELRVDMPAIGPDTVKQAHAAGLAGIVVEAGHALLIDRDEIIRQANELGLFVCGRKVSPDA